jgi:hypothetical protein
MTTIIKFAGDNPWLIAAVVFVVGFTIYGALRQR